MINLESNRHMTLPIENIIIHPNYSNRLKINDIALIKLPKDIRFSSFIRPACIDFSGKIRESTAIATGFGVTEDGELQINYNFKFFLFYLCITKMPSVNEDKSFNPQRDLCCFEETPQSYTMEVIPCKVDP